MYARGFSYCIEEPALLAVLTMRRIQFAIVPVQTKKPFAGQMGFLQLAEPVNNNRTLGAKIAFLKRPENSRIDESKRRCQAWPPPAYSDSSDPRTRSRRIVGMSGIVKVFFPVIVNPQSPALSSPSSGRWRGRWNSHAGPSGALAASSQPRSAASSSAGSASRRSIGVRVRVSKARKPPSAPGWRPRRADAAAPASRAGRRGPRGGRRIRRGSSGRRSGNAGRARRGGRRGRGRNGPAAPAATPRPHRRHTLRPR